VADTGARHAGAAQRARRAALRDHQRAKHLRLDGKTGSLTPRKEADILLLDATALNVAPLNSVRERCVAHGPEQRRDVIVAGKVRKWKGRLLDVDLGRCARARGVARLCLQRGGDSAGPVRLQLTVYAAPVRAWMTLLCLARRRAPCTARATSWAADQREVGKTLRDPDSYRASHPKLRIGRARCATAIARRNTRRVPDACPVFFEWTATRPGRQLEVRPARRQLLSGGGRSELVGEQFLRIDLELGLLEGAADL